MTLLRTKEVKCRKPFKCMSGFKQVSKGEVYLRDTVAWDGSIYDWKQCLACAEAMNNSDRPDHMYPEEAFTEGWAYNDRVGCCAEVENG